MVDVYANPDLTKALRIRPDGMISLSLIGEMMAAGLTPKRLGEQIAQALSDQLNNPIVHVDVLEVASKTYTITGAVLRTGQVPMPTPVHIFDALNASGGFQPFANKKKILVIRENGDRLEFNWEDFSKGKNLEKNKNFLLQNKDTIIVKD